MPNVIVTQLVVSASGAEQGVAQYIAALKKAEQQAIATGNATARTFEKQTAQWVNSLARIDPIMKAQIAMEKDLARQREINTNAVKLGITTQAAADAQIVKLTQYHKDLAASVGKTTQATTAHVNASKLQRYEMINLGRQLQDVGVSLFSGQNPLTVLVQQGSQIADISASSGVSIGNMFKQVGSSIGSVLTPVRVLTGGIVALAGAVAYLGVQWDGAQKETERALIGIGARTGTTVRDINSFAKANSSAAGLSVSEARNAAIEFTKTGNIAVAGLHGVGEAIHGYAVLTGTDATDATKKLAAAFSGDLTKGADELNKTYGFLDSGIRKQIETLQLQGDRMGAVQLIVEKMAPANIKAAASVDFLTRAWTGFKNVVSNITSPPGQSDQDRLSSLQSRRSDAASTGNVVSGQNPLGLGASSGAKAAELAALDKQIDALQKKIDSLTTEGAQAQLRAMSTAGDAVVKSIIPQIEQIDALNLKLKDLQNAQNTPGVSRSLGADDAAVTAIQTQLAALKESEAATARYNQRVAEISKSWGDVGQATALALQQMNNQLPVADAVGGAAKLQAQYQATINDLLDQSKSKEEAIATAKKQRELAQAQINAGAKEMLFNLQNQAGVAAAVTGSQQIAAQAEATKNKLIHDGVAPSIAMAVAAQEEANARAAATAAVLRQVIALKDSTLMIKAQTADLGTGNNYMEATTAGAIAFKNAIDSGASSTAAAALQMETLANYAARAAMETERMAQAAAQAQTQLNQAVIDKANGTTDGIVTAAQLNARTSQSQFSPGGHTFAGSTDAGVMDIVLMLQRQATTESAGIAGLVGGAYASGGIAGALAAIKSAPDTFGADPIWNSFQSHGGRSTPIDFTAALGAQRSTTDEKISAYDQLVQLQNSQTADKGLQASNIKDEIAYFQTLPSSLAREQKITDLTKTMQDLISSTDNLNQTNQDLLSPYYTQDPRTSHIGFRSQGMASTGYVDIPGTPSANDNVTLTLPVASGERVFVGNGPNRGNGGSQISVVNNITVSGNADKSTVNAIGRTVYQSTQSAARNLQAAQR